MSKDDIYSLQNCLIDQKNEEIKQDLKINVEMSLDNIIIEDYKKENVNEILEVCSSENDYNKNEKNEEGSIHNQKNRNEIVSLMNEDKKKHSTNNSLINLSKEENENLNMELNKDKENIKTSQNICKSSVNITSEKLDIFTNHDINTCTSISSNKNSINCNFNNPSYNCNSNNTDHENNNNNNDKYFNRNNSYSDSYFNTSNKKKIQLNVSVLKNMENANNRNNINSSNLVLDIDLLPKKNDVTKSYYESTSKKYNDKEFSKIGNYFSEFDSYKFNNYNSNLHDFSNDDDNLFSFSDIINNFKNDFENKNKNIFESVSKKGLMFILTMQEIFINKTKKILCSKCNDELHSFNNINNVFKDILKLKIEKQTSEIYMTSFLQKLKKDFLKRNIFLKEKINEKNMVINNLNEDKKVLNDTIKKYEEHIYKMKNYHELRISQFKINVQNNILNFTDFVFQLLFKVYSLFCEKSDRLQFLINRFKNIQLRDEKIYEKKKNDIHSNNNNDDKNSNNTKKKKKKKESYVSPSSWDSSKKNSENSENSSIYLSNELCYSDLTHMNINKFLSKKKKNKYKKELIKIKNSDHRLTERSLNEKEIYSKSSNSNKKDDLNYSNNRNKSSSKKINVLQETNTNVIKKLKKYKKKYSEEVKKNKTLKFLLTNKEEEIEQMQKNLNDELQRKELLYENEEKKNIKEINELRSLLENQELNNKNLLIKNKEYSELNEDLKKKLDVVLSIEKELNNKLYELNIIYEKEREKNSFLLSENIKLKNVILQFSNSQNFSNMKYYNKNKDYGKYDFNYSDENNEQNLYNAQGEIYKNLAKKYLRNNENKNPYEIFDYKNNCDLNEEIFKENYLKYPNRIYNKKEKRRIRKSSLVHNNKYHYDNNQDMFDIVFNPKYRDSYKKDYNPYRDYKLSSSCYSDNSIDVRIRKKKDNLNPTDKTSDIHNKTEEEKKKKKWKEKEKKTISNQIKNDILNFDENNYKKIINNITKEEKEIEKIKEEDLYSIFMQNWKESNIDNMDHNNDSLNLSSSFINNLNKSGIFINNTDLKNENLESEKSNKFYKNENEMEKIGKQEDNENVESNYDIACIRKNKENINNDTNNKNIEGDNLKSELNGFIIFAKNRDEILCENLEDTNKKNILKEKDANFEEINFEKANFLNSGNKGEDSHNRSSVNNNCVNSSNDNNEEKGQAAATVIATEHPENEILITYEIYKKNKEKFMNVSLRNKSNEYENKIIKNRKDISLSDVLHKEDNSMNYKKEEEIYNEKEFENLQNVENNNDLRESVINTTYRMNNFNDISLNSSVHEIFKSLRQDYDNKDLNFFQASENAIDTIKKNRGVVYNNDTVNYKTEEEFFNCENTSKLDINKVNNVPVNNSLFKEDSDVSRKIFKPEFPLEVEENNKNSIENDTYYKNNNSNNLNSKNQFKNTNFEKQNLYTAPYEEKMVNVNVRESLQKNKYQNDIENLAYLHNKLSFKNNNETEINSNCWKNGDNQHNEKYYVSGHDFLNIETEQSKTSPINQKKEICENAIKKKNPGDRGVLSRILRKK